MSLIKRFGLTVLLCILILAIGLCSIYLGDSQKANETILTPTIRVEQTQSEGMSLKAEILATPRATVGTQRVTATVTPSDALYDLEWSLAVGNSKVPSGEMSDYLTITKVGDNSIDLVCKQRFDGYVQLKCTDSITKKSATAMVSAWNFGARRNLNPNFTASGTTSFTYLGTSGGGYTDLMSSWQLYAPSSQAALGGRVHATANDPGLTLNVSGAASGSAWIYLLNDAPKSGTGASAPSRFTEGSEWYIVAETDRSPAGVYGGEGDFSTIGTWYQNGLYVAKIKVIASSMTYRQFGIGFMSYAGMAAFNVNIRSISLYEAG